MLRTMLHVGSIASLLASSALAQVPATPPTRPVPPTEPKSRYEQMVDSVRRMTYDQAAQGRARHFGLNVVETAWEDNGRTKGSVWGPLISDYSIYVHIKDARGNFKKALTVPILRHENFTDKTADQPPSRFFLKVGNQKEGSRAELVSLAEYLAHLSQYLTDNRILPRGIWNRSLLSPRDTDFVVSAQASFIPLPEGENAVADFTPALYQYQSNDIPAAKEDQARTEGQRPMQKNPAVLAILATREGTSATIIDNKRDQLEGQTTHGQPLFYNLHGLRAPFQAKRKSDFIAGGGNPAEVGVGANGETGLGMVLMIQVPLKHKETFRRFGGPVFAASVKPAGANREEAVIGHGTPVGPFTELAGLDIERDERYPIRVTVQFYQAVASADLRDDDFRAMQTQINRIYSRADAVGSLVTEGDTGRVTEHQGPRWHPPVWWHHWWHQYAKERSGLTLEQGVARLSQVYGANGWQYLTTSEDQLRAAVIEARIKLKELDAKERPLTAEEKKIEEEKNKK